MKIKTCNRCNTPKNVTEFYRLKKNSNKRQSYCKACDNKARADRVVNQHLNQTPTVYKLTNIATGDFYIGSTEESLAKRWWTHKTAAYNKYMMSNLYQCMRVFNDDKYWTISPLQKYPGASTRDLRRYEQEAIEAFAPSLNTNNAIKEPSA